MSLLDLLHIHARKTSVNSASQKPGLSLEAAQAAAQRRRELLQQAANGWTPTIRRLLAKLARARWPAQPHVGRFPVFAARLRQNSQADRVTWWVEHDIPPYDRFRCAAYFVDLKIEEDETCTLTVRSGQSVTRLAHPTAPQLERALADLLRQPPAIIPRQMGEAWD